jgi:protein-disulfide isomerase
LYGADYRPANSPLRLPIQWHHPDKRAALHHNLLSQSLDATILKKLQAEMGASDAGKAKSENEINQVRKLAADLNIQGTPALVVGSEIFTGP